VNHTKSWTVKHESNLYLQMLRFIISLEEYHGLIRLGKVFAQSTLVSEHCLLSKYVLIRKTVLSKRCNQSENSGNHNMIISSQISHQTIDSTIPSATLQLHLQCHINRNKDHFQTWLSNEYLSYLSSLSRITWASSMSCCCHFWQNFFPRGNSNQVALVTKQP